jgi:hypothetical protein
VNPQTQTNQEQVFLGRNQKQIYHHEGVRESTGTRLSNVLPRLDHLIGQPFSGSVIGTLRFQFSCEFIVPCLRQKACEGKRRKSLLGADLHLDNAPARNCEWQTIAQIKPEKTIIPIDSPETARNDFVLFEMSNGN